MEQACGAASAPSHRRLRRRNWRRGCRGSSWSASAPPSASSRRVSNSACMSPASTSLHSTRSTAAPSIAAPLSTAQAGPLRLLRARLPAPAQGAPGGSGSGRAWRHRAARQPAPEAEPLPLGAEPLPRALGRTRHLQSRRFHRTRLVVQAWATPEPRLGSCRPSQAQSGPVRPRPKAYRAQAFGSQPVTTSLLSGSTWQNEHGELTLTLTFPPSRHKVWLKPSAEQSFLYGNHVLKAGYTYS